MATSQTEFNELDDDSMSLPPPPTLRRHNAMSSPDDLSQRFYDTRTKEIVHGNPDLTHHTNQFLVKLPSLEWRPGKCKPYTATFFKHQDNKHDEEKIAISQAIPAS